MTRFKLFKVQDLYILAIILLEGQQNMNSKRRVCCIPFINTGDVSNAQDVTNTL